MTDDELEKLLFVFIDPSGIDFQKIEQEGHIKLSDAQRMDITVEINVLRRLPHLPCPYPAKEIRRRFRKGIFAGYQFLVFMDFSNKVLPNPFECEGFPQYIKTIEFITSLKERCDSYNLFCNRIKNHLIRAECFLKDCRGKRGRPEDHQVKHSIFNMLTTYEQAGGKVKVSWNTRSQHYTGAALAFVKSVLTQAGRAPQSDDALAQLILTVKK